MLLTIGIVYTLSVIICLWLSIKLYFMHSNASPFLRHIALVPFLNTIFIVMVVSYLVTIMFHQK